MPSSPIKNRVIILSSPSVLVGDLSLLQREVILNWRPAGFSESTDCVVFNTGCVPYFMNAYIYILTNSTHSVLYIGVTNNLVRRIYEHKNKLLKGFTCDYSVNRLVYYEQFNDIVAAITREKQLKNWHRPWKENLIAGSNPTW